jgi:hypothetical protein
MPAWRFSSENGLTVGDFMKFVKDNDVSPDTPISFTAGPNEVAYDAHTIEKPDFSLVIS